MVELLLEEGARTLAESQRAQDHSRRLEVETRELILMYRSHRVPQISGGIREVPTADGPDPDHVRARVRLLVNPHETPKLFAGYSTRASTCDICARQILRGAHEYEIVFSALTFILDRDCFGLWQEEMRGDGRQTKR